MAYLMICSPFEATILWSVGQGDHKTSVWPTTSALEPLWGCAKHTQKHTPDRKKTFQRHMHIRTHSVRSTRRWKNYVFSTGDCLCQQPVLRWDVCSLVQNVLHILWNTDWILNQKHDLNQQTWANEISLAQSANQTSVINSGKVWSRLECSCRHFWATGGATTKGVTSTRHKGPFHIHVCMRVLLCIGPFNLLG